MSTTKTSSTTLSTEPVTTTSTTTTATLESAPLTTLKTGEYEVLGGTGGTGTVEARLISQVSGKYYSDTRLPGGTIQIDMTKEFKGYT